MRRDNFLRKNWNKLLCGPRGCYAILGSLDEGVTPPNSELSFSFGEPCYNRLKLSIGTKITVSPGLIDK